MTDHREDRLFAAIDCGTNSTRLLIGNAAQSLDRRMQITRLGEGVNASGELNTAAIERTLDVLRGFREVMDSHEIAGSRVVATSAVRDAANRDLFVAGVEGIVGVAPEVLSGEQEAELSFVGATADLDPVDGPFLVMDIGGGSTEFAVGSKTMVGGTSIQMGCVRMTEKHIEHDPPLPEELANCLAEVRDHLDDVVREIPAAAMASRLVGLAGTVSTVAAVEQGLAGYDRDRIHHFVLDKAAVEEIFRTLATESTAERLHNPGLPEGRADVIVGGLCVLVATMRQFGFVECLVSEADILDGLILSQVAEQSS